MGRHQAPARHRKKSGGGIFGALRRPSERSDETAPPETQDQQQQPPQPSGPPTPPHPPEHGEWTPQPEHDTAWEEQWTPPGPDPQAQDDEWTPPPQQPWAQRRDAWGRPTTPAPEPYQPGPPRHPAQDQQALEPQPPYGWTAQQPPGEPDPRGRGQAGPSPSPYPWAPHEQPPGAAAPWAREQPAPDQEPHGATAPWAWEQPGSHEEPPGATAPWAWEQPGSHEEPPGATAPWTREQPGSYEEPDAAAAPWTTEQPAPHQEPHGAAAPWTREQPAPREQSPEAAPPWAAGRPASHQEPRGGAAPSTAPPEEPPGAAAPWATEQSAPGGGRQPVAPPVWERGADSSGGAPRVRRASWWLVVETGALGLVALVVGFVVFGLNVVVDAVEMISGAGLLLAPILVRHIVQRVHRRWVALVVAYGAFLVVASGLLVTGDLALPHTIAGTTAAAIGVVVGGVGFVLASRLFAPRQQPAVQPADSEPGMTPPVAHGPVSSPMFHPAVPDESDTDTLPQVIPHTDDREDDSLAG